MRLEKGCLTELVDFAIELTKNACVPAGTVFVIGP